MGFRAIASTAGVAASTVQSLKYRDEIYAESARRIMAVRDPRVLPGAHVCAVGTRRRLQALVAIGYDQSVLSRRLGMMEYNVSMLIIGRRDQTTPATVAAVKALFKELEPTHGGSKRALNRAQLNGWVPPMAWDEDAIDDPTAQPFIATVVKGHKAKADNFVARIQDHRELGHTDEYVAKSLGISMDALKAKLRSNGLGPGRRYRDVQDHLSMQVNNTMSKKSLGVIA